MNQQNRKNLKAAVIGIGPHGLRIAGVLAELPGAELVAAVDRRAEALAAAALPEGVARLSSTEELYARGDVGLVAIATNGPSHAKLALEAMDAGVRHLMIEKPMACSLAECDTIIARARETGTRITVDHVRCYAPAYLWLRDQIASGRWGKLKTIWMQRPGIGLGCNAVHSFAAITMLAGAPVERVTGWVDPPVGKNPRGDEFVDPGGLAVLELAGGVRAVVAQIEDGAGPMSADIHLTAGRIRLDERFGTIEIIERDLSVKPGPNRPPVLARVEAPEGLSANSPLPTMVRGCLEDLLSDRAGADGSDGRASTEVLIATYLSHEQGNVPVKLPLTGREALERSATGDLMKRLAIVGYGNIAPKHMEVFRALGCQIVASVNKSPERREQAMREGKIPAAYAVLEEMLDREKPDGVVVCPSFDQIFPVAKVLAPRRIPALLEKPTGVSLAEFNELCQLVAEHKAPQMVGLNRRHYSVVNRAITDAGGFSAIRSVMIDWSEDPAHLRRKGFTDEQISRWVFSNSIHGLDLLTYLAGNVPSPQITAIVGERPLDWYMSLAGKSDRGALADFRSSWGSPGRWRLNICTPDRRYVFAPLESCEVQERGASQVREILPDEFDARFKAGFHSQARLFLQTIEQGQPPTGFDLESVRPAMTLAERLTEACVALS